MVRGSVRLGLSKTKSGTGILAAVASIHALALGCGASSKSRGHDGSGAAANAARGGETSGGMNASSGASSGTGGEARGGTGAAPSGGAGTSAGGSSGGSTAAGAPGAGSGPGGMSSGSGGMAGGAGLVASGGADAGSAGNAAAGADDGGASGCLDLCSSDAPMCCSEELHCIKGVATCRLDILDGLIVDIPNQYSELEAEVAELSGEIVMTIGDIDVETALVDPAPSGRIELELSARASELHGPGLELLRNRAFRVSCDDELLFLGLVYDRNGAAAVEAPVMHVEEDDDGLVTLLIGSRLGVWTSIGNYPEPELNARIDHPELRAAFCARGVLGQLETR